MFSGGRLLTAISGTIHPEDLAGKVVDVVVQDCDPTIRLMAAIKRESEHSPWLRHVHLETTDMDTAKPDVVSVIFDGVQIQKPAVHVKLAPQRNSEKALKRSAWLSIDRHPHIAPVLFMGGPNLFFIPFDERSSCNACSWLAASHEASSLAPSGRQQLVFSIALQVANA